MLVAADVNRAGCLDQSQRFVASCLRPTVRVEVGVQAIACLAMKVGCTAKTGLRQNRFHHALVTVGPIFQKFELSITE